MAQVSQSRHLTVATRSALPPVTGTSCVPMLCQHERSSIQPHVGGTRYSYAGRCVQPYQWALPDLCTRTASFGGRGPSYVGGGCSVSTRPEVRGSPRCRGHEHWLIGSSVNSHLSSVMLTVCNLRRTPACRCKVIAFDHGGRAGRRSLAGDRAREREDVCRFSRSAYVAFDVGSLCRSLRAPSSGCRVRASRRAATWSSG